MNVKDCDKLYNELTSLKNDARVLFHSKDIMEYEVYCLHVQLDRIVKDYFSEERNNMIDLKCPCGKEGEYFHTVDGEEVSSCNKYNVCKSYDDLLEVYHKLKFDFNKLYKAALSLSLYREGTSHYDEALAIVNKFTRSVHE